MALYFAESRLPASLVDSLFAKRPDIYVHLVANLFFLDPEKSQDLRDVDVSSSLIRQEGMGQATDYRLAFTTPEKAEAAKRMFREERTAFELVPVGDEHKLVKLQHYENPHQEVEFRLFQPRGFSREYSTGIIAGKMGKLVRALEVRATLKAGGPPLAIIYLDGPRLGMPQLMIDGFPFQAVEHQEGIFQESLDKKVVRLVVDGVALQEVRDQVALDRIPATIDGRKRVEAKLTPPFEHINCVGFLLPLQHERPSPDVLNALRQRYERVLEPDEPL